MESRQQYVDYEQFGACGNGKADDMEAICAAHAYANAHGLPVKTRPDGVYYIGAKALTAFIETDVDWNTSRFIIDDVAIEDCKLPCFHVRSTLAPEEWPITSLTRDQKQVDIALERDCYVSVTNDNVLRFIRKGPNRNMGTAQNDGFIVKRDGTIVTPIDWDYETITAAKVNPMDDTTLTVRGGTFTTLTNRGEFPTQYYSRGIEITRSRTVIDGVIHYVENETGQGSPYNGFFNVNHCADITLQNCFVSGHKIYSKIGAAGTEVMMGTYDISAYSVVNLTLIHCRMNHITDESRWGVFGSNFCKNIVVKNCTLSRLDAHMGVSGVYSVTDSEIGWMGIKAIGRGTLLLERVTAYTQSLVDFRDDYGSTWEGEVLIRDCKWIPVRTIAGNCELIRMKNNGMHDFGYVCHMPKKVEISNLLIDDTRVQGDYHTLSIFSDPDTKQEGDGQLTAVDERPYSYVPCEQVISHVEVVSGKTLTLSVNQEQFARTVWSQDES